MGSPILPDTGILGGAVMSKHTSKYILVVNAVTSCALFRSLPNSSPINMNMQSDVSLPLKVQAAHRWASSQIIR